MKKGLIITLPNHDLVTEYLSQFSKGVIKEAEENIIQCKKIQGKDVTKTNVEKACKSFPYKLIVFNGHGDQKTITGHDFEPLVIEGKNENILVDRIVYARACDTAFSLGKKIASLSAYSCFIGYELPFQFYHDSTWEGSPLRDPIVPLFLEPSNYIPLAILRGKTPLEAHKNSKRAMLKNINKALRKKDKDSLAIAEALWNNYEGQVILGNVQASL